MNSLLCCLMVKLFFKLLEILSWLSFIHFCFPSLPMLLCYSMKYTSFVFLYYVIIILSCLKKKIPMCMSMRVCRHLFVKESSIWVMSKLCSSFFSARSVWESFNSGWRNKFSRLESVCIFHSPRILKHKHLTLFFSFTNLSPLVCDHCYTML